MKFILLALILATTVSACDNRVKVTLYSEGGWTGCQNYMSGTWKTAIYTEHIDRIAIFEDVPYGLTQAGTGPWTFDCEYGADECLGHLYQICALHNAESYKVGLKYGICLEEQVLLGNLFEDSNILCAP